LIIFYAETLIFWDKNFVMRSLAWAMGLSLCLVFSSLGILPSAVAKPISVSPVTLTKEQSALLKRMAAAQILYLGETHDRPEDHEAQLDILQSLQAQNPKMVIALEMIQRPYQGALDRYIAGITTEAQLRSETDFDRRWGFDWEFYAPIFRFARAKQIPLLALNTPTEILRKVSRPGLKSLTGEDFKWIPKREEIDFSNTAYRQRLQETYDSFHQRKGRSAGFDRFVEAQVLWDETMADAIVQYVQKYRDRQVVVLAGQGHLLYGDGIPSRVQRRLEKLGQGNLKTLNVLLNPPKELQKPQPRPVADGFWKTIPAS
jgi:uncharacterized iron-regulated protein